MPVIPVEYLNPFLAATKRICSETLKIPVTAGKPRLCQAEDRVWKMYQISAVIRLDSAVRGLISLSFSEHVAIALASGLAEKLFDSFDDDARDALGEVANLVVGVAKRDLPGGLVTISTPKIVNTLQIEFPTGLPIIILPFETGPGRFLIQVALSRPASAAAA